MFAQSAFDSDSKSNAICSRASGATAMGRLMWTFLVSLIEIPVV